MRLLLDINVILDVICHRPGEPASSALIAACGRQFHAQVAWHSISTLAYLIQRQRDAATARAVITDLLTWAEVAPVGQREALAALRLPMSDFEDAMQSAAALACGAQYIITRNGKDFVHSPVPALTPEAFLASHSA